jgi:MFS family permease
VPVGCAVVVAGTLAVAVPNGPVPVVVGLVVAGLGTAAFYPVTLARLVQVPGMSHLRGPAFGALASGTAILVAPVVLAALGAALDLRAAYLLAVLPLAAALATTTRKEPAT